MLQFIIYLFFFIFIFQSINSLKVGVIGCTGAVGSEIINCLYDQKINMNELRLFSSKKSAGKMLKTKFGHKMIEEFNVEEARKCDVNFLSVNGDFSRRYARALSYGDGGSIVIDNSSEFRLDEDVPLIIPEINFEKVKKKKLISNPNCTTAIALIALYPILKKYGILKIIMSTYQSSSGAGYKGMKELEDGVKDYVTKNTYPTFNNVFQKPLPFNVIPHIDKFLENGYTKEEMKVVHETRKIFDNDKIDVSCTSVRVPTFRSHCESIIVETEEKANLIELKNILSKSPGIKMYEDVNSYPTPISSSNINDIEVGRVRQSLIFENGIELFICGDQLLRGAALNAVLILRRILETD